MALWRYGPVWEDRRNCVTALWRYRPSRPPLRNSPRSLRHSPPWFHATTHSLSVPHTHSLSASPVFVRPCPSDPVRICPTRPSRVRPTWRPLGTWTGDVTRIRHIFTTILHRYAHIRDTFAKVLDSSFADSRRIRESSRLGSRRFATDSRKSSTRFAQIRDRFATDSRIRTHDSHKFARVRDGYYTVLRVKCVSRVLHVTRSQRSCGRRRNAEVAALCDRLSCSLSTGRRTVVAATDWWLWAGRRLTR